MRPIVFLHIPKTAGQTIHFALAEMVGARNVSPIRVNGQAVDHCTLPPGYLLHSGHIDWTNLDSVEGNPFVFTVLRDPAERIGSFPTPSRPNEGSCSNRCVAGSSPPSS